jgi:mRNA interferase MazF
MKKLMPTFDQFDVVVVPFPYTDKSTNKRRPAVILSSATHFNNSIGQSVMAMITTAQHSGWPLDVEISNLDQAGLPAPSMVRMKLFTLDQRMIIRSCGSLAETDQNKVRAALKKLMP